MAKSAAKRRQKKLQRKAAKRKVKRQTTASAPKGRRAQLRTSGSWRLHESLLTKAWRNPGEMVQIVVARRSPRGQIAVGAFMVDLGCMGVKAAFGTLFDSEEDYREMRNNMRSHQDMTKADVNLVAKILRESIAYAKPLGFRPDPGYRDAVLVLGDADPDVCEKSIPLGKDGKPLFIPGPDDKVDLIMAKLTRKLGPEGFNYIVPLEDE
jgi:hypothetical protein